MENGSTRERTDQLLGRTTVPRKGNAAAQCTVPLLGKERKPHKNAAGGSDFQKGRM